MTVFLASQCILQGRRSKSTRLWHVTSMCLPNLPPASIPTYFAASAISTPKAADLVAFAHAALFSPVLSTFEKALADGFLINFPGLTLATLRQHPPHSIAEIKGHLDQTHQNLRSNQKVPTIIHDDALTISRLGDATDIIATSLQDIGAHALAHPSPRSPVAPLPTTHKTAIRQLINLLSQSLPDAAPLPLLLLSHH